MQSSLVFFINTVRWIEDSNFLNINDPRLIYMHRDLEANFMIDISQLFLNRR